MLKFCRLFSSASILNYRKLHKYIYKMDKAYLRFSDTAEQFQISFHYANLNLKVDRTFNFSRQATENVGVFIKRIASNIDKIISKKKNRKKASEDLQNFTNVNVSLSLNGNHINEEVVCGDLFKDCKDKVILKVVERDYEIVVNSPWVDSISLPNSYVVGFPVYPCNLKLACASKEASEFKWYKSTDKINWTLIGEGFYRVLKNEDINNFLKIICVPKNDSAVGPETEAVSDVKVEANPGHCPFDTRHEFTKNKLSGKEFRVVSYNILADLYSDSDFSRTTLFPYCPIYALNMSYRKLLIVKELLGYNADLICLQEVDQKVYNNDLDPVFNTFEYDSTFQLKGGTVMEGLACFYKRNRFKLLESNFIVLGEHVDKNPIFSSVYETLLQNKSALERLTQRSTVVQTNAFQCLDDDNILLVANTHLYFHPDADHIRLLQGGLAIIYIVDQIERLKQKTNKSVSLVFCGDFNSTPECGIYKLYTTGHIPNDHFDWESNVAESVKGLSLTQPLSLKSACGTPSFTNYTAGFQACLDYIYYDSTKLEVTQVVPLPHEEEFTEHIALPNVVCPSDHLALVSDFKWLR